MYILTICNKWANCCIYWQFAINDLIVVCIDNIQWMSWLLSVLKIYDKKRKKHPFNPRNNLAICKFHMYTPVHVLNFVGLISLYLTFFKIFVNRPMWQHIYLHDNKHENNDIIVYAGLLTYINPTTFVIMGKQSIGSDRNSRKYFEIVKSVV